MAVVDTPDYRARKVSCINFTEHAACSYTVRPTVRLKIVHVPTSLSHVVRPSRCSVALWPYLYRSQFYAEVRSQPRIRDLIIQNPKWCRAGWSADPPAPLLFPPYPVALTLHHLRIDSLVRLTTTCYQTYNTWLNNRYSQSN